MPTKPADYDGPDRRQWERQRPELLVSDRERALPGYARTVDTWPGEMFQPITSIARYDNNPRQNEQAVMDVVQSLSSFGARQPIAVDEHRVIVVGDTRFLAALHLQWPRFPVHVAHNLTAEEARAYRIADNKIGERAEWDFPRLKTEFEALGADLLALTGFRDFEWKPILASDWTPPATQPFHQPDGAGGDTRTVTFTDGDWSAVLRGVEHWREHSGTPGLSVAEALAAIIRSYLGE